jgi:oxygen-dependent protoporphyrinogen oxidase
VAAAGGELAALLGAEGAPVFTRVNRYVKAMPQYQVGHLTRVDAIESAVRRLPGLALAGAAYRGVGIADCIHSGEEAAERLLG